MSDTLIVNRDSEETEPPFELKTPLARTLWQIRQEAPRGGVTLLDLDGTRREIAERRYARGFR
jgi:hypothetical protein